MKSNPPGQTAPVSVWDDFVWGEGGAAHSFVLRDIFAQGSLDEPPVPHFGLLTGHELTWINAALRVRAGDHIVDLACGEGWVGRWVAERAGAQLTGIDVSTVAIANARKLHAGALSQLMAKFEVGTIEATGLPDTCCDAVMSIDAIPEAADPADSFAEVARILKPGGRFAYIGLDWDEFTEAIARALLLKVGFDVIEYRFRSDWSDQERRLGQAYFWGGPSLRAELGDDVMKNAFSQPNFGPRRRTLVFARLC